jgi:3-oxoacyl-[acyl-carrier protein] reductase
MPYVLSLEGKIALVTGGSQGIGETIARRLAAAGATVLVAARNQEKAAAVVAAILDAGGSAEAVPLDVADPSSVPALFKGIAERHGRLDVLVNNAGITDDGLLLRMSKESWDRVLATDLTGVFLVTQEAVKLMMKKRVAGRIVTVGSVVGLMGNAGQANYAAAKAGVVGFSMSLAREIGSRGITVNVVAPGYIETAMTEALSEEQRKALAGKIVLGRLGNGEDVAGAVLYLASDLASYVTGTVLNVSGGLLIP